LAKSWAMLEISRLDAFYDDSHILREISLDVPNKGRVAVVGRNGAGKTTLMKSILNAGPRIQGRIAWRGQDLDGMPAFKRSRLGMTLVPEDRRIFPHLTVAENIRIAGEANRDGVTTADADSIISLFEMLQPLRSRLGSQLSGGQQQMLAVARGVAARPRLLLLDEPTEGLAPIIVRQLAQIVASICASRQMGLLLSEQNLWFARNCTDLVHVIDSGRLVFSGDWAAFDAAGDVKSKYLAV
jgi:ABC-type branched-subunit amino acid transport system ATPase component